MSATIQRVDGLSVELGTAHQSQKQGVQFLDALQVSELVGFELQTLHTKKRAWMREGTRAAAGGGGGGKNGGGGVKKHAPRPTRLRGGL